MFTIPLLLLPPAPVLSAWRATCKAARAQAAVYAAKRQQPASPAADTDSWASTEERRRASFTYSPPAAAPAQRTNKPPATQPKPSKLLRRQQQQQQPMMQPDPAANDLDALAAQAATITPTASGSSSSSTTSTPGAGGVRPSVIYSVPAADQPTRAAALQPDAGRQLRYTAADKLHLTAEAAQDIARRLRKAGPPRAGQPILRVFR
jgi:hypothetical protein